MSDHQPGTYTINCAILGETSLFPVDIASNKTVGHLKDAIKEKKPNRFAGVAAYELALYHVDISGSREEKIEQLKKIAEDFGRREYLHPFCKLTEIYSTAPPEETIHILVQPPQRDSPIVARGIKRKRDEVADLLQEQINLKKLWKPAPSSLATPSEFRSAAEGIVCCNRPFNFDTIPIDLFQPEFGEFKKDCAMAPTTWAQKLLQKLTESACGWYDNETHRRSEIHGVLKEAGLYLRAETISGTEYKTDGNWKVNIMPPAIRKCKNEFGCALLEAIAYYAQFLKISLPSYRHARFPCILMIDVGPRIAFYGCLWTGKQLHVEPLTPTHDLTTHWTDEIARNAIASSLDAFKKTVGRLGEHYKTLATAPSVDRTFPCPTGYKDETGQEIKFTYQSRLDDKLVFRASVDGSVENNNLCVKFTKRYSERAHRLLADLGHAPRLRAVTSLPADWTMVVMDFSQYVQLPELTLPSNESRYLVRSKINDIVQKLHDNDLVHGDIREVNFLVDPETLTSKDGCAVHLIDFDWAGKDQEVKYPGRVNTVSVRRPHGASDGELITKSHDRQMLAFLPI